MKDVVVTLTQDHLVLSQLAERVQSTSDRLSRNAAFDELAKALGGHLSALEGLVLPALLRAQTSGLATDVLIAHMVLKRRLADLLAMNRKTPEFDAEVVAFCAEVEAQADREQLELLPCIRHALNEHDRAALAGEVEAHVGARLGDLARDTRAPITQPRARDLLQEAHVVLTSLAGRRHKPRQ